VSGLMASLDSYHLERRSRSISMPHSDRGSAPRRPRQSLRERLLRPPQPDPGASSADYSGLPRRSWS
jgi:hypothetical protein